MYIYKVTDIHSFFVIFNCNLFSALHANHFEILRYEKKHCETDEWIAS